MGAWLLGLVLACIALVVVSAVCGYQCIALTTSDIEAALALILLCLVLTVPFTLGACGISGETFPGLIGFGSIVVLGFLVGVGVANHAARQG